MKSSLLIIVFFFVCLTGFSQSGPETWDATYYTSYTLSSFKELPAVHQKIADAKFNYRLMDAAIFFRTNEERIKYNLPEFYFSIALEKAALGHSVDMVQQNFFSHQSTMPGKENISDRLHLVGVEFMACAENIYDMNHEDPTYWSLAGKLVTGWMNSTGHRRNILNPIYKFLGCGAWPYSNPDWPNYKWFKSTQNFSDREAP